MREYDVATMVHHYAIAALWSSSNDLFGVERCDKCTLAVREITNSYGTEWRDAVDEMDADCTEGGDHEVADPADHSEMLDGDYGVDDLTASAMAEFESDCEAFYNENGADLAEMDADQAGHDFWLTRNHHGAGFWDRGLGGRGERLTSSAHVYGEVYLYTDDDQVSV